MRRPNQGGFTLIELIVLVMILGLLAALRTASELVYATRQIAGMPVDYTMGDVVHWWTTCMSSTSIIQIRT